MAPEQASGAETTRATDLYALGAILHECLSGAPPHRAPDLVALLVAVKTRAPDPLPADVPPPLAELVARLLRKAAAERPQDASEVAAELEGIAAALRG
jgi:serine/threonine-protein kinase